MDNMTDKDMAEVTMFNHKAHIASVLDEQLEHGLADGWTLSRFSNELYKALTGEPRWKSTYGDAFDEAMGTKDWQKHLDSMAPKKHQNYRDMSGGW